MRKGVTILRINLDSCREENVGTVLGDEVGGIYTWCSLT